MLYHMVIKITDIYVGRKKLYKLLLKLKFISMFQIREDRGANGRLTVLP